MSLAVGLDAGLAALKLALPTDARERLLAYIGLLQKWNRVYNLTAVREPEQMLSRHLLDSLAVVPHVQGRRILDVGSGGGLPGIPLAIARPEADVTLLDSNHKKATFLQQVCIELKLANARAVCSRAEAWQPEEKYEVVISRAFSDLAEFAKLAGPLCAVDGVLAAMKGLYPYDEIGGLPANVEVLRVIPLHVPGLDAERHLVELKVKQ